MKILVDAVGLQRVSDLLRDYYHACNTQEDKNVILFDARTEVQKLIDTGIREDSEWADKLEQRIATLENKRPKYVAPPVYGPIRNND